MIERIEIVKGSNSVLYGSEAMGGVINVILKSRRKGRSAPSSPARWEITLQRAG